MGTGNILLEVTEQWTASHLANTNSLVVRTGKLILCDTLQGYLCASRYTAVLVSKMFLCLDQQLEKKK